MTTINIDVSDDIVAIVKTFGAQLRNPGDAVSLLARFVVGESDREAIKSAFQKVRTLTLEEVGCQVFELNEDSHGPGHFIIYERWSSLADLETHLRKDHTAELRSLFHRLIVEGPEFQVLLPAE